MKRFGKTFQPEPRNKKVKEVFAYNAQVACDKYAWVLGYSIHAENVPDSLAFPDLFDQIKDLKPTDLIADSGYKTPSIAYFLLFQEITPVFPYTKSIGKTKMQDKLELALACLNLKTHTPKS
ncbi:hypothetical protein ScFU53_08420 [Streptococcus canis]|nr:hypothetical protein ScFU129_08220 [Streptococcus canis]GFG43830.1 hypothetical protein ScFU53_08420 [Streptococcus canis]GFG45458.1 hypothetical protein ScFU93_07040 [Streptococcus canis]